MSRVPKSLFSKGLDDLATRWYKNTLPADERIVLVDTISQMFSVAEALLVSPKVTFKVYGENVVVPLLAGRFGVKGLEALVKEGAIEFMLWRSMVLTPEDDTLTAQGVHPLMPGSVSSDPHKDPHVSAELGIMGWGARIPEPDRKRLIRLVEQHTVVTHETLAHDAVDVVKRAYGAGELVEYGFDGTIEAHRLSRQRYRQLAVLAESAMEAAVMLRHDCDLLNEPTTWSAFLALFRRVQDDQAVRATVESVLTVEGVPSVSRLIKRGAIRFEDIVDIRSRPETEEFRKWLWSQPDPQNATAVSEAYLAAMSPGVNVKDRAWFKASRIVGLGVAGSVLGTVAAGPVAGAAAAAISTGVGVAVSLLDGFLLERVGAGRNPRRFATDVLTPIIAQHSKVAVK